MIARGSLLGLLALVALGSMAGCSSSAASLPRGTISITTSSGTVARVAVEVADTDAARETGLMHRRTLAANAGMAFVFRTASTRGFWMKDTLIPLSIAYWARSGEIVRILDMAPCTHDPCPVYAPGAAYVGALEVHRGWFAAHGVATGDHVSLTGTAG